MWAETTLAVAVGGLLDAVSDEACDKENLVGWRSSECEDMICCEYCRQGDDCILDSSALIGWCVAKEKQEKMEIALHEEGE